MWPSTKQVLVCLKVVPVGDDGIAFRKMGDLQKENPLETKEYFYIFQANKHSEYIKY